MATDGLGHIYWTLHDLKRKGVADSKDKKIAGHKTYAMQQLYNTAVESYHPPEKEVDNQPKRTTVIRRKS